MRRVGIQPGQKLGAFQIAALLGKGGMLSGTGCGLFALERRVAGVQLGLTRIKACLFGLNFFGLMDKIWSG